MRNLTFVLLLALAACGGEASDPDGRLAADAGATCVASSPPDGSVEYMGTTVFPKQCGQDPSCTSPICWLCAQGPGGATWNLTGNEQCRPGADAGAES
jgi:hypothetical protein